MQWIIDNQASLLLTLFSSLSTAILAAWWQRQKLEVVNQLLQQQLESEQRLSASKIEQLQHGMQQLQTELDDYDQERDQAPMRSNKPMVS